MPPVGKSGAFTCTINSSTVTSLFSIKAITPSETSVKLCGAIFVAIPTAIPLAPFNRRFGIRVGSTVGSSNESSKFKLKSTVSLSISASISSAILRKRASVYRIAAGLSPSTDPKLPCPSTRG